MANLLDEVLIYYEGSFGILPNIMTNMSYMDSELSKSLRNISLVNMDKYQTAQEYAKRVSDLYDIQSILYQLNDYSDATGKLESGLVALEDSIYNKASPLRIMEIVHMQIHPALQIAYNLTLQ